MLTWERVLAWRLRRQLLDPVGGLDVAGTVRRLCGIQAQVMSAAELAVATRLAAPVPGEVADALGRGALMRTWAMRGTLHLLDPSHAGAFLALLASRRTWERPAWQRTFGLTAADVDALAAHAAEVLDGRTLTREELIDAIAARTGNRDLDEHLRSGWGAALKPLAWMGVLCNGPSDGNRVTFTSPASAVPGWQGLPSVQDAAPIAVRAYLGAFGPATPATFDAWLTRGSLRRKRVREWFDAAELAPLSIDDETVFALPDHVAELEDTPPSTAVRLLAGFDQYLLGPGTGDPRIVPPEHRKRVSRTAGWISPVVVEGGRVTGVWSLDGDAVTIAMFDGNAAPDAGGEVARIAAFLGRDLRVAA
jgi:Winged helix DNA-binding domain